jgi:uncharacterized RDD family membrane protein YckC
MSNPQYPNQPPGGFPPPQQGGYQPQQGGFPPPPQGGYQPQQGGYQPQPGFAPQPGGYQQPGYPQPQYGYGAPVGLIAAPRATFGQRLGATIIDWIVIGIPIGIIEGIATAMFASSLSNISVDSSGTVTSADVNTGTAGASILVAVVLPMLIFLAYYIILIGRGQTVGDKVAGIRIIDANGNPPGYLKALIRLIVQQVLGGIFFITYLWVLWDADRQTLHDKAAGTICISART